MRMELLVFLNSVSFLSFALRKLPEAFGLTASKSWYPHYLNTTENHFRKLNYNIDHNSRFHVFTLNLEASRQAILLHLP